MLNLERIRTFLSVIDTQSFSKTAAKLSLSVPAVSKQIRLLETEIGAPLLTRTTRRVSPTEVGLTYYDQCKILMQEVEITEGLASRFNATPSGTLRVFASSYFGEKFIVPFLREFLSLYPKINLDLDLGERVADAKEEALDIIFGLSISGPEQWIQKLISETRYVICASPKYFQKMGTPQEPIDLKTHHYIQHKMRRPKDTLTFTTGETLHIKPILYLNDTRSMLKCAVDGLGIVQLHDYVVSEELTRRTLVEVLKKNVKSRTPVYLYYRPSKHPDPKIRAFVEFFSKKTTLKGEKSC